jgi:Ca2+-binding RTX toxin-like protein
VEHANYDTLSILKTLEERYRLPPLNKTDAAARSMVECFQDAAHAAIDVAYTQPDAERPCRSVLVVGGTPWADQIHISNEDVWTVVRIRSAGNVTARRSKFRTSHLSRIEVYGQGGDDNIQIESPVTLPALVLCGSGNTFVRTGGGPSIVVSGDGESAIEGGAGRNVLIGGQGHVSLKAGPRGDILIAGSTDYDANISALRAILRAWAAPDIAYADRVARLSGKQIDNLNGPLLTPAHIHRSRGGNLLEGGPNFDWYFGRQDASHGDDFKNRAAGEVITGI